MSGYVPTLAEVTSAVLLAKRGHLPCRVIKKKAAGIVKKWSKKRYTPSPAEVHRVSSLAANGHLPRQIITKKAESLFANFLDSLSELQCGAALATLGHITQVENLRLYKLDTSLVPASDLSSLVKCVTNLFGINNVTGDLAPVLSNLQCRML